MQKKHLINFKIHSQYKFSENLEGEGNFFILTEKVYTTLGKTQGRMLKAFPLIRNKARMPTVTTSG